MRRLTTALAGAAFAALAGGASSASATTEVATAGSITPEVSCYAKVSGGYRVFFGYTNSTGAARTLPVGLDNEVQVDNKVVKDAGQPTRFEVGTRKAVFSVVAPITGADAEAEWEIGSVDVEFDSSHLNRYALCGPEVSLPASGNGLAPVLVIGGAALVGGVVLRARRRTEGGS
jgi:hypothetical protein